MATTLAERMRIEFSQTGIEVASEGSNSMQLKTPGAIHNLGEIICRIEELEPSAVVDVTTTNGELELLVSWKPRLVTGSRPALWPITIGVVGILLALGIHGVIYGLSNIHHLHQSPDAPPAPGV